MEHQLWTMILPHLVAFDKTPRPTRHAFRDARILAIYLWAVVHDRPTAWACDAQNWPRHQRRHRLPSPATVSKRLRSPSVGVLFAALFAALTGPATPGLFWMLDGKPLPISGISGDREGRCGRAAGGLARGYKLHAILDFRGRIAACEVAPMNVDERVVAERLLAAGAVQGYIVADANYDSNPVHACCDRLGNRQLLTPRRYARPANGHGHRRQSLGRLRCLERLDHPFPAFTQSLLRGRGEIERLFGNLTNWGGGLSPLPAWVRTLDRVNRWVRAKLILTAVRRQARIRACVA